MSEALLDFDDLPEGDGVLILSPEQVILSASLQAERLLRRRLEPLERPVIERDSRVGENAILLPVAPK